MLRGTKGFLAVMLVFVMVLGSVGGIAIIFITHRLQEILDVCDRIVILRDGQVVKEMATRDTDIGQVAELMVGRSVSGKSAVTSDYDENTETIDRDPVCIVPFLLVRRSDPLKTFAGDDRPCFDIHHSHLDEFGVGIETLRVPRLFAS